MLVTVRFSGLLVVPVAQFPNAGRLGLTLAVWVAATPVPVKVTGAPLTVAPVAVIVAVPL